MGEPQAITALALESPTRMGLGLRIARPHGSTNNGAMLISTAPATTSWTAPPCQTTSGPFRLAETSVLAPVWLQPVEMGTMIAAPFTLSDNGVTSRMTQLVLTLLSQARWKITNGALRLVKTNVLALESLTQVETEERNATPSGREACGVTWT